MDALGTSLPVGGEPGSLLDLLLKHSSALVHLETLSGVVRMGNKALAEAFGLERSALEGQPNSALWKDSQLLDKRLGAIDKALATGSLVDIGEEQFTGASGTTRYVKTRVAPAELATEPEPLVLVISEDITKEKALQQELQDAQEAEDRKVKERTSEIMETQDRLVRQERLTVLGRIAGNIAHEVRNPLSAIHQALFLLQMELDDAGFTTDMPIVKEQLDIIEMELNHSNEVITRMMEQTRVKGKNWDRVDIEQAIQQAENQVWIGKEANLIIDIDPKPYYVWGDMVNFRQVFANLLDNCKAALVGVENPEVIIKCRLLNGGKLATMEVTDNGCGIPDDIKELVWETLFTTTETGTGLGLCIAREVIEEKYGGEMWFTSEVGKGTTMTTELLLEESVNDGRESKL